jgi:hypothetical protein
VADRPANAAANAAETAPVQQPIATTNSTTAPVSAIEQGGEGPALRLPQPAPPQDFVTEEDGTFIPADSSRAAERREEISAEENRARWSNSEPQPDFTFDRDGNPVYEGTPEYDERRREEAEEAEAIRSSNAEPVPPNLTVIQDESGETWGIWDNDRGVFIETGYATEAEAQRAAGDPFEAARLERASEEELPNAFGPEPVPPNVTVIQDENGTWGVWNDDEGVFIVQGLSEQEAQLQAEEIRAGFGVQQRPTPTGSTGLTEDEQRAKDEAAAKANAINQATRQSVYKQGGSSDWRVRLQLAPTSNYLYNQPEGQRGILDPLFSTNGVIFPYTPQIQTTYQAKYTDYDLVHSNFRGVFYQSSRVDDINIRAEFTAQDTNEANYLLAVIHFFRSVTKMFYGKDTERGTPPPLVYLSGLGMDQFYGHPCLVRSFQYTLPNNVDYIRATNVNNYGTDLLTRRKASAPSSAAGLGATGNRILNAGLEKFFPAAKPAPNTVVAQVNNMQLANYVPTKIEIDIVLIPVQTRSQASKQFSLKGFANGNLIRNGFW